MYVGEQPDGPAGPGVGRCRCRSLVCAIAHGLNRLAWLDRPTGAGIRRYERDRPGELIHVDEKVVTCADLFSCAAAFFPRPRHASSASSRTSLGRYRFPGRATPTTVASWLVRDDVLGEKPHRCGPGRPLSSLD